MNGPGMNPDSHPSTDAWNELLCEEPPPADADATGTTAEAIANTASITSIRVLIGAIPCVVT